MRISSRVYGDFDVTEPVIQEIIQSPAIQRLKGIDQAGYIEPYFPGTKQTRYEHSIGCYILLHKYGASREEQIAGLIHDVSHTVFSHCSDYIFKEGNPSKHTYQDDIFRSYVMSTNIPDILEKYGYDVNYILDEHNFPLQERELPDLCGDRIDYFLLTLVEYKDKTQEEVLDILSHLHVIDGDWVFDDINVCHEYAKLFFHANKFYYSGIPTALMFHTVSSYIKYAFEKGYIQKEDFFTTDEEVLKKIQPFHKSDEKLAHLFDQMNGNLEYTEDRENYNVEMICKSRIVDPYVLVDNKEVRLSKMVPEWKEVLETENKPKKHYLRVE
ncbi:MAG: HD domain-containing protein [Candidatus Magasanikbacteria bacterium]